MKKPPAYEGNLCYVGHDQEAADGRLLEGGWHYTAVVDQDAKDIAVAHAEAQVKLLEKRANTKIVGPLIRRQLFDAREALEQIKAASWEVPGEKLVQLKDGWRLAADADKSHYEKHHQRLTVVASNGSVGEPRTDEEIEATHRHLHELEARLKTEGVHDQEHDHVLTTKEEIAVTRRWLKRGRS